METQLRLVRRGAAVARPDSHQRGHRGGLAAPDERGEPPHITVVGERGAALEPHSGMGPNLPQKPPVTRNPLTVEAPPRTSVPGNKPAVSCRSDRQQTPANRHIEDTFGA